MEGEVEVQLVQPVLESGWRFGFASNLSGARWWCWNTGRCSGTGRDAGKEWTEMQAQVQAGANANANPSGMGTRSRLPLDATWLDMITCQTIGGVSRALDPIPT